MTGVAFEPPCAKWLQSAPSFDPQASCQLNYHWREIIELQASIPSPVTVAQQTRGYLSFQTERTDPQQDAGQLPDKSLVWAVTCVGNYCALLFDQSSHSFYFRTQWSFYPTSWVTGLQGPFLPHLQSSCLWLRLKLVRVAHGIAKRGHTRWGRCGALYVS